MPGNIPANTSAKVVIFLFADKPAELQALFFSSPFQGVGIVKFELRSNWPAANRSNVWKVF
ncbi:MAG: hypothetical protein BWY95_01036 [Bacteroidetes bacterium ADurb.BinA104]|nr:MAG: hypothetical protein BWY95_01036 [Bacteroidetes bacterium ADurb.BinA104]